MRIARWISSVLLIAMVPSATSAQGAKNRRPNPGQAREDAKAQSIDQLAEQVYQQADRNHNQVLSRTEYKTADELLQNGIQSLAQQGILGQPGRPPGGAQQAKVKPPNGAAVFGAPPVANKNRVTLAEFKAYAHTLAQEADTAWAQVRATMPGQGRGPMGRGRPMPGQNMPRPPLAP
jgi:hypothetical protein